MTYGFRVCKRCGKEFIPASPNQIYCSQCRKDKNFRREYARNWYREMYSEIHKPKICPICGKEFTPRNKCQIYCYECITTFRDEIRRLKLKRYAKNHPDMIKKKLRRHRAKRRQLGFIPLTEPKEGYVSHHLDKNYVIYMPEEEHTSIWHCVETGQGMDTINALAWNYLRQR